MDHNEKDEKNWVQERLDALIPDSTPAVREARSKIDLRIAEKEKNMWQKMFAPKYRRAWITLAVIAVVAISFSFPGVRAVANSFLGLFRVERIEAVSVGISLDNFSSEMEPYFVAMDNLLSDQIEVEQYDDPVPVSSLNEAEAIVGFELRQPALLDDKEQSIVAQSAATVKLTIDRERWLALLESMGYSDFDIPTSADGAVIKIELPNMVIIGFGNCEINAAKEVVVPESGEEDCTIMMQSETPTVEAPPGFDINYAGQLALQALGMSAEDAEDFTNRVDWATTLVVPVPQGAKYRNVQIDGADAVLLEDKGAGGQARFTLLWVKDGMFYALTGNGSSIDVLTIANSMQ